ncbi:hypothetical protein CVT25_000791 [Psilocybe cyanescens]|uniref:Uncharacterized protein n=1 Tax=Psilocybe cyanescens TaxID=93625 RepID=A0A409XY44_PSICY|nr:hypothetical protein CVT25_000791 [Psilocybe cyanescens]
MSPASCELLHHLQKAWELAHGAPFVEDRLTHEEAATVLGEMQFHLASHLLQYEDQDFEESEFAISVRRTLAQRIFLFVKARSLTFEMYRRFFPGGSFTTGNTISWDVNSLAGAAFLGTSSATIPPRKTTEAITSASGPHTSRTLPSRRDKGKGKARAVTPTPASPVIAPPPLRSWDILEIFAQSAANHSRSLPFLPVAGPSGVRRSPTPVITPAPVDPPSKRKRGAAGSTPVRRGINATSYSRKKLMAIAALEANPGEPVLRAASPDDPPINAQELAGLGDHQPVPLMICAQCALSDTPSACTFRGLGERCGPCQKPKTKPCSFRAPPPVQMRLYNRYAQMGSLSINALRSLCRDLQEARRLEVAAIDHAAQLQSRTLDLEFRLSETIQTIVHNSPAPDNALAPLFDGDEALRRAAIGFSLFDLGDPFCVDDPPLRNLHDLLRAFPPHNFERFPQLYQMLQELGYMDEDGSFVPPASRPSVAHPMLDLEAEEAASGEASSEASTKSGSSDREEETSGDEGLPEKVHPAVTEESSNSGSDDSSDESEDDRPPSKKVRLTC